MSMYTASQWKSILLLTDRQSAQPHEPLPLRVDFFVRRVGPARGLCLRCCCGLAAFPAPCRGRERIWALPDSECPLL